VHGGQYAKTARQEESGAGEGLEEKNECIDSRVKKGEAHASLKMPAKEDSD